MKRRIITVKIELEPELHEELRYALMSHTKYQGCFIMQFTEYRNAECQRIGEYMLREARENE